jgi:hypothetical protein
VPTPDPDELSYAGGSDPITLPALTKADVTSR